MTNLKALSEVIIKGDQATAVNMTKKALTEGIGAESILNDGLIAGMDVVGDRFSKNEIYIPEMLIAARAMKSALEILKPELAKEGVKPIGKMAIGTVQGDLHDIGKNLVAMMLKGAGFEVVDLGVDVKPETFVEKIKETGVQLVGLSALLTTTMPGLDKTIKALRNSGLKVKVMIGGAPVTQEYADKVGANGYAPDAASAVDVAKSLVA